MKVEDAMNPNVHTIRTGTSVRAAAEELAETAVADLAVLDASDSFAGVLSEGDLLRAVLPSFSDLIERDSLSASREIFAEASDEVSRMTIDRFMITAPITLDPKDDITRAAGIMNARAIRRLPVVSEGKLVGTLARGDNCRAALVHGAG
jgi:CBS domain-containing protein